MSTSLGSGCSEGLGPGSPLSKCASSKRIVPDSYDGNAQAGYFGLLRSFGLRLFLFPQPRALQNVRQRIVAFMAGVLVDMRISRRPGHFAGPRTLPGIWIFQGEPVQQRAIAGAREALG